MLPDEKTLHSNSLNNDFFFFFLQLKMFSWWSTLKLEFLQYIFLRLTHYPFSWLRLYILNVPFFFFIRVGKANICLWLKWFDLFVCMGMLKLIQWTKWFFTSIGGYIIIYNYIWGAAHLLVDSNSFGVEYCPTCRFPYSFHLTKHPCNVPVWDLLLVVTLHTRGSKVKTDSWHSSAEPQYCSCNFKLPLWRMAPKRVKSTQWQPSESKKEFT